MKIASLVLLFLLPLLSCCAATQRRILHQPLFPIEETPPPSLEPPPPPPPPDQPFFPETPNNGGGAGGQTPDQGQNQPFAPSTPSNLSAPLPIATQPSSKTKKVTIAISVGIVTLGMLTALVFFIYRHKAGPEAQKLVNGGTVNSHVSSAPPPSGNADLLYLGTMEPATTTTTTSGRRSHEVSSGSPSPYHKLNSVRNNELYRPSPELQPLPPLRRTNENLISSSVAPLRTNSSSVASSEDMFYSPNGSAVSYGDGIVSPYSPMPKPIFPNSVSTVKNVIHTTSATTNSNPHSRRSSPKSRLSYTAAAAAAAAVPDVKQVIVQPTRDPQSVNSQPRTPSPPKRKSKFTSPVSPPPSNLGVHVPALQASKASVPPPPPPPPPPPSAMAAKNTDISLRTRVPASAARILPRPQSMMPTPTRPTGAEVPEPIAEVNAVSDTVETLRDVEEEDGAKPKLKPLHWDKVRATSDRAMVWDQFKSSSFHLNEDMIETLFGCNSKNPVKKESPRILPSLEKENRVLDPKKSQNIAIQLRALNVTRDEVSEALLEGNPDGLGAELLETLVRMAPTKEEELKLRDYSGDISKLGTAERFLKTVLDIPFAFKRVDAMLYRANFDTEVKYLRKSFETLRDACEELKNSRLFLKLLEAVLRTGNRMNVGTNRGDARAFKLDTLLKLLDIKGIDGKTTLLHFVVQEIIRSEAAHSDKSSDSLLNKVHPRGKEDDIQKQGLLVVSGLGRELANVKKAAGMDSDVLSSYVSKLELGLEKVRNVFQYEKSNTKGKFFDTMKSFLDESQEEIRKIKIEEKKALYHVKEVTEYFHGDTAKEEAHPFRIFMVVRDFLNVLDQVCKEVGKMHERTIVGSARSFRIPASAPLPVLNRYNVRRDTSSDEDSSSP